MVPSCLILRLAFVYTKKNGSGEGYDHMMMTDELCGRFKIRCDFLLLYFFSFFT